MKEIILEIIEEISAQKTTEKKTPVIVLDSELRKAIEKRAIESIRQLYRDNEIDVGRTINNNFIELRTPDSPRRNRKAILHKID